VTGPAILTACARREPQAPPSPPEPVDFSQIDDAPEAAGGDRPALPSEEPVLRVRVLIVRDKSAKVRFGAAGRWIELSWPEGEESAHAPGEVRPTALVLHAPVEVAIGPGGFSILDALGFRPAVTGLEVLELRPLPAEDAAPLITVQDRPYPGVVRLVPRGDLEVGGYDVVNHVAVESYLPGVLSKELYRHWHPRTFAAQAIAARSFACAEHAYFKDRRHYDLTNTASSQVYGGSEAGRRAVEGAFVTRGTILAHGGRLVPGYYSSCCGGVAADARDAIGDHPFNDVPPLRGRSGADVCTEAPLYSWTIERSARDLAARLKACGEALRLKPLARMGSLRAIEVSAVNAHGRPREYAVLADGQEQVRLPAEALRRALDYTAEGLPSPEKPLWSSNVRIALSGQRARIDGHGHGHGVGLCQHGAEALARAGLEYAPILTWYYPEAELVQAYG
jgi:stage II sporulation protein D